jgi:hypothetical protein
MALPTLPQPVVETATYFGWLLVTIVPLFVLASLLVGLDGVEEAGGDGEDEEDGDRQFHAPDGADVDAPDGADVDAPDERMKTVLRTDRTVLVSRPARGSRSRRSKAMRSSVAPIIGGRRLGSRCHGR